MATYLYRLPQTEGQHAAGDIRAAEHEFEMPFFNYEKAWEKAEGEWGPGGCLLYVVPKVTKTTNPVRLIPATGKPAIGN